MELWYVISADVNKNFGDELKMLPSFRFFILDCDIGNSNKVIISNFTI